MSHFIFDRLIGGFFYANIDHAKKMIPDDLLLLQPHAEIAIVDITFFNFIASEVGAYSEVVISLAVVPWAPRGDALPCAAFYPVFLATNTDVSRSFAGKRWNLPMCEHKVDIEFSTDMLHPHALVILDGKSLLELHVKPVGSYESISRMYQCFVKDEKNSCRFAMEIKGKLCEHEDEKGHVLIAEHPVVAPFQELIYERIPFREQFMEFGDQYLEEMQPHGVSQC